MAVLKTLLFTVCIPGTVTALIPFWLLSMFPSSPAGPLAWLKVPGWILIAGGVPLYLWCAGLFSLVGRGTPLPLDPPKTLVARGAYRWTRNPMYVAVVSILVGEAMVFHSVAILAFACGMWGLFHLFIVLYEERALARQFGPSYEAYRRSVPRWLPWPWQRSVKAL